MDISQKQEGNTHIIILRGRLDASTSSSLEEVFESIEKADQMRVIVNCGELDYISSAGLRVLLSTAKELKKLEGQIGLAQLNSNVRQVFEISGFTSIFPIFESLEEGKKAFSA